MPLGGPQAVIVQVNALREPTWRGRAERGSDKDYAARVVAAWSDTVRNLPVGVAVTGEVVGRQPFGVFLGPTRSGSHPDQCSGRCR